MEDINHFKDMLESIHGYRKIVLLIISTKNAKNFYKNVVFLKKN